MRIFFQDRFEGEKNDLSQAQQLFGSVVFGYDGWGDCAEA
jgi:hypothetical protein